jgi:HK97 gp10 family phage protein
MMQVNTSGFMPSVSIELEGDREAVRYLNMLAVKYQRRVLVRAARKAAKPLVRRAKALAPKSSHQTYISAHRHFSRGVMSTVLVKRRPGELSRSIGVYLPKNRGAASVYIGPRTKNVQQVNNGWYGHFVELGTKGYTVKRKRTIMSPTGGFITLEAGDRVPGQRAHPFLGPAWQQTGREVISNFKKYLWEEIEKV